MIAPIKFKIKVGDPESVITWESNLRKTKTVEPNGEESAPYFHIGVSYKLERGVIHGYCEKIAVNIDRVSKIKRIHIT